MRMVLGMVFLIYVPSCSSRVASSKEPHMGGMSSEPIMLETAENQYDENEGIDQNYGVADVAAESEKQECNGGRVKTCKTIAIRYLLGEGVTQDYHLAEKYFKKACEGGDASSCLKLALMYSNGEGVTQDDRLAEDSFKKACDAGYAASCAMLGGMYREGDGVAQDHNLAVEWYLKGCDQEDATSCFHVGEYLYHQGGDEHKRLAMNLYRKACDEVFTKDPYGIVERLCKKTCDRGEAKSCVHLGLLYTEGRGVTQDKRLAKEYFKKACDEGDENGCSFMKAVSE